MLAALREQDPSLGSLSDYVNGVTPAHVVPTLIAALDVVEDTGLRESLIRALTLRGAGADVARALLRAFAAPDQPEHVRWTAGNALLEVRDPTTAPEIVRLVGDPQYGAARQMLALALGFLRKTPGASQALIGALSDKSVMAHAAMALKRRKAVEALPALRGLDLVAATTWQRRQVETAIKTLEGLTN